MSAPGLTDAERRTLAAAMDRVLPGGEGPGAAGANAVGYAEWAARQPGFGEPARHALATGLRLLDSLAAALWERPFAECAADERDAVLRRVEETPHPTIQRFFVLLVRMTVTGLFCAPSYGGNRGGAGWAWIGFAPHPWTAAAEAP